MIDEGTSPPEILLVEHTYRSKGAWGLPGGSLESIPGNPNKASDKALPDDVIEFTLRREVAEELGMDITVIGLLRIDAIPYVVEEPGSYRLDFYFRCAPQNGFVALRDELNTGATKPRSPEIGQIRFVPLPDLSQYDLYSPHDKFLRKDLPPLEPGLLRGS